MGWAKEYFFSFLDLFFFVGDSLPSSYFFKCQSESQVFSNQSSQVQSSQVKSSQVQLSPVKSSQVKSRQVKSSPVQSSPVKSSLLRLGRGDFQKFSQIFLGIGMKTSVTLIKTLKQTITF